MTTDQKLAALRSDLRAAQESLREALQGDDRQPAPRETAGLVTYLRDQVARVAHPDRPDHYAWKARQLCPGAGLPVEDVPHGLGARRCIYCRAETRPFANGLARPHAR